MKYLLSLLLLWMGVATADVPMPNTPAGKILGDYLVAFNSGDAAQVNAFNARNGKSQAASKWDMEHREMSGGLALLRVLESEPLRIVVLVQEKDTERPLQLELTVKNGSAPVMEKSAMRNFGHGGGAPGMNSDLRIFPELGYVLVVLSNIDPIAARTVVDYYAARMPID